MVLTVHHLCVSQSERIVFLCEELGIPYELKTYQRSPLLSPPAYLALHPLGAAPVIQDDNSSGGEPLTLAESAACVDYIIHVHGSGRLAIPPGHRNYADYLYWYHFTQGSLQPAIGRAMALRFAGVAEDSNWRVRFEAKIAQDLQFLDQRLGVTGKWLVGEEFTAADVMVMFTLTTMRKFYPMELGAYGNVVAYVGRVAGREGYRRAMARGDPELDVESLVQGASPPLFGALLPKAES
ncbi:hypothetical protein LTR08_006279 [Meristemomyces frigidus]|nr:hypothetical protein LTR08_006279 [Meristemomyces frigidus]